jgi:hypothetical protein
MVQNPDDVSGGSDQDDSDLERETGGGMVARQDDSDDDDDPRHVLYEGAGPPPVDDDDDDDDDDEDDELPPTAAVPKSRPTSSGGGGGGGGGSSSNGVGTMDKFLMKPSAVAASKRKSAAQTKEMTKNLKQKAMRTGSASAWAAGAPPKHPTNPSEEQQTFSLHSEDSDDGGLDLSVPQNRGVPMPPPDCIQEFENQRTNGLPSAAASDAAPKVHPDALKVAYVMKNEKVNKWWKLDPSLLVHAPDPRKTVPFSFAMEELTIASKPLREAMQKKMCNESLNWMAHAAVIYKLPTDGKVDLPLSDAPGIVMAVPYTLKLEGDKSLGELRSRLANEDGTTPDTVYGLLALGSDAIKAVYGVKPCPLPSQFDPTKPSPSTNAKWKVPSKLEEYLKTEDDRFLLGALEKAKRSSSQKRPSEDGARGSGSKADGKADGKRPANGAAAAAAAAASAAAATAASAADVPPPDQDGALPEHGEDTVSICGNPTLMKVFASKDFATSYAELRCAPDQRFTVCQAGPGKFILLLGPVARS